MREWKTDLVFPDSVNELLAKEIIYPTSGSIVRRRIQAYALIDGVLCDWAKVWFCDASVKTYPWDKLKYPNNESRKLTESILIDELRSECFYTTVTREDVQKLTQDSLDYIRNSSSLI